MLNIEKYKEAILNDPQTNMTCCVKDLTRHGGCYEDCIDCKKAAMKWLLEEYKEPVLDDAERKYLSEVLRPFREEISTIAKYPFVENYKTKREYIIVRFKYRCGWSFPTFKVGTMYKGMETQKEYTLKELGL